MGWPSLKQRGPEWITAAAAVVAIGISLFSLYKTYSPPPPKPFEPSVAIGNPMLRETLGFLTIALSAPLTNNGDQPGCIADIAVTLESKTLKTRWNYFPAWKINPERYLKPTNTPANASAEEAAAEQARYHAIEAPMSPTQLPGKNTQDQVLLFLPRPSATLNVPPLAVKDLTPGETYVITVFLLRGDAKCGRSDKSNFEQFVSTEFVLGPDDKKDLAEGVTVIPVDRVSDTLRERFISGHK